MQQLAWVVIDAYRNLTHLGPSEPISSAHHLWKPILPGSLKPMHFCRFLADNVLVIPLDLAAYIFTCLFIG